MKRGHQEDDQVSRRRRRVKPRVDVMFRRQALLTKIDVFRFSTVCIYRDCQRHLNLLCTSESEDEMASEIAYPCHLCGKASSGSRQQYCFIRSLSSLVSGKRTAVFSFVSQSLFKDGNQFRLPPLCASCFHSLQNHSFSSMPCYHITLDLLMPPLIKIINEYLEMGFSCAECITDPPDRTE